MKTKLEHIRRAFEIGLMEHWLIRIAQLDQSRTGQKQNGVLPVPTSGKEYGLQNLAEWARRVIRNRTVDAYSFKPGEGSGPIDRLLPFGLRVLKLLGGWGTALAAVVIGLTSGLVFLPSRIFSETEVTLPQILIPVLLGIVFVLWQILNGCIFVATRSWGGGGDNAEDGSDESVSDRQMLRLARRVLPPFIRWNMNLGWCVFWGGALFSMVTEYAAFRDADDDRDYVYRSQYMPLDERLVWLHRVSIPIPDQFRLPDAALAWADSDYRSAGYVLQKEGEATSYSLENELAFDPSVEGDLVRLTKPPDYDKRWFWFLFGVIFTYGLAPRLIALPLFGFLLIRCRVKLYDELLKDPYTRILNELNEKPTSGSVTEEKRFFERPKIEQTKQKSLPQRPCKEVLAVSYQTIIALDQARECADGADIELFGRPAGDVNTNTEIVKWLEQHEQPRKIMIFVKIMSVPDRPFVQFVQTVTRVKVPVELIFIDLPKGVKDFSENLMQRTGMWRKKLGEAGLESVLPPRLRMEGATDEES